ncbi:MAG TPA: glycosylase, partial [Isosphaeraceae bacterium]|nr:glycosylase [Isosphaeraceae bacterium]
MLLKRHYERLLLSPSDLKPSRDDFEVVGVFNPGAIVAHGEVILLVRVAERPRERRQGYMALPRWAPEDGLVIDWVADDVIQVLDPRVVKREADGLVRLTFISHIRVVRCGDGRSVKEVSDVRFSPATSLEEFGVEDPRITAIDGRYFFTYVAVSRHGAATALASTADFRQFDRHGVIFCPENKDVVLFPERIGGQYVALHRPNAATPFCRPEMWIARSPDLIHWGQHECLHGGGAEWETGRVGAGTPPVRVDAGWLEIYHGNR